MAPKEGLILKALDAKGNQSFDVSNNCLSIYLSPWGWGDTSFTYEIKTFDEATYRNRTVKITLDKPEGIRMTLRGNDAINSDTTEYNLPYNDEYENVLTIRATDTDNLIYKITADGQEVAKQGLEYPIALVDRSDEDNIKYVENIVVTQEFPEDMSCNVKLSFTNGDPGCIKSITYGGEAIEDFAGEDGFNVRPGKKLIITLNKDDYKILSYQKNDEDPYQATYVSTISDVLSSDIKYTINAEKYEIYNAVLIIDNADLLRITKYEYPYPVVEVVNGENPITFKNDGKDHRLQIALNDDNYEIVRMYDHTYDKEIAPSTTSSNSVISLEKDSKIEITTGEVIFDKEMVFYIDDVENLYFGASFKRAGKTIKAASGYNLISFRDKEGLITINADMAMNGKAYRNGEEVSLMYYSSISVENPQADEVYKLFFNPENAIEHTVTFDAAQGVLDGYVVKKDIKADVDVTAPVQAVGKTRFTIAPASRADNDLTVTVGDQAIEAVDGIFTFETEADTTVKVSKSTSGVEDIVYGDNEAVDVYNLQGIRVARQASADRIKALPAGIYVINGNKVAVK